METIQLSTSIVQLQFSNFFDFQMLKYDAFKSEQALLDVTELVDNVIKMQAIEAQIEDLNIVTKKPDNQGSIQGNNSNGQHIEVMTDAKRVAQVFQNVLRYAIYAS